MILSILGKSNNAHRLVAIFKVQYLVRNVLKNFCLNFILPTSEIFKEFKQFLKELFERNLKMPLTKCQVKKFKKKSSTYIPCKDDYIK